MWTRTTLGILVAFLAIGGLAMVEYARPADKSVHLGTAVVFTDAAIAAAQDKDKGEHWAFYVNFDKTTLHGPSGCLVRKPQGVGDLLDCTITAPPEANGYITRVEYRCESGPPRQDNPCNWVHECPAQGAAFCTNYHYAYEPHDMDLAKSRTVDWYGSQNDGNHGILHFDVFMREQEPK